MNGFGEYCLIQSKNVIYPILNLYCFKTNRADRETIKSKRYTRTRIQRILLHALLNITKDEVSNYKYNPQYIRVLGFTKTGEKLLSQIYNKANIPIVTSVSKFLKSANDTGRRMIEKDILATNI